MPVGSDYSIISAGTLADAAFKSIADELLWSIKAEPSMGGVYFCLYDWALFLAHGFDLKHFDAVVTRSPHC